MQKFWNLESVDVSKNEFDVCENFEADISFANNRYKVKLPFKSEHGMLNVSLNDCLYPGPSLTATSFGILLRFRIHNIAFVGDIEKAFLLIGLHPSHKEFVRYLWFQEPGNIDFGNFENKKLTELRFCKVLFAVTSSLFLSFATIIHHMNKYSTVDKEFVDRVLSSLHVDNLSTEANNVGEAFDYFCKCKDRLEVGSFSLRKYQSNSAELEQMVNKNYGMLTE